MCPLDSESLLAMEPGAAFTAGEIAGQPELWMKIYRQAIDNRATISSFLAAALPDISRILLTGAGTSAYIGLNLHGIFSRSLGVHTDAVATTDLVSHPGDYFFRNETIMLVSFARSGNSPESTAVVELADQLCKKCYHLIVTCDPDGKLGNWQTASPRLLIVLPPEANDKSLAMTGSYSGMLLFGLLITHLRELDNLAPRIEILRRYGKKILSQYAPKLKEIANMDFKRVVFLGSGSLYGTATESNLKLQELTDGRIICKNHSYLGFRHGPKAVTDEDTLVVFILSNDPFVMKYEHDLILSMKKGKKPLFTIGIFENEAPGLHFDLEIKLSDSVSQLDEEMLAVCDILPAQLLGLYKSIALGLNPDSPSESGAISRVVEDVTIYKYQ
jgi:tagatose-6-phosphate ketose/aldose isomerase